MVITHTYLSATSGRYSYLFFLLLRDDVEEELEFSKRLMASLERFARNLKSEAALVRPFTPDIQATRGQVLDKPWSDRAEREILKTPSLLMIDRDFDEFDPNVHSWLHIRIPLQEREAETDRLLTALASLIISGPHDDIFRRAHSIGSGQNRDPATRVPRMQPRLECPVAAGQIEKGSKRQLLIAGREETAHHSRSVYRYRPRSPVRDPKLRQDPVGQAIRPLRRS